MSEVALLLSESHPYTILKCTQGTFNQGDPKFGETRGLQCTCIARYSICFSVFKKVSRWRKNDLDCVLEKGDRLYKVLNVAHYLSFPEVPTNVTIGNLNINIRVIEERFGSVNCSNVDTLIRDFTCRSPLVYSGIQIIIKGISFAIIPCSDNV